MPISAAGNNGGHACTDDVASVRRSAEHGFMVYSRSAEHGFTLYNRSAEHGFTLVELMVVVTVIALASAAAVLALPDPKERVLDEAMRFAARLHAAHDAAIVEGRPVSVWVTTGGYGFDRRSAGRWSPFAEAPLRVAAWSEGTRAALPDATGRTRVAFDPTGLADHPAEVRLERGGAAALVRIGADGSVHADAS